MLQQERPEDFVIATGQKNSVRDFVDRAAQALGMQLSWTGAGVDACACVVSGGEHEGVRPGQVIVRVDARYFRPTEVETLLGDASKAREKLGWEARISFDSLVREMIDSDLAAEQKYALIRKNGFTAYAHHE